MTQVVPSQIVALIERNAPTSGSPMRAVSHQSIAILGAVIRLVDELPPELLTINGNDYENLLAGVEGIRNAIVFWQQGNAGQVGLPAVRDTHPLILIHDALLKCPDQAPSETTTELSFISDEDLRDSIRLDISSADDALHNGQWKAATVLAGAAAEALLLWAIQQSPRLTTVNTPKGPPEQWDLSGYIAVAGSLGLVKADTVRQAELARYYRNLIHPGRAQRLGTVCDRGTALTALAAVELIARDIR